MGEVFDADFRIVADYVVVQGNEPVWIGDDPDNNPTPEWKATFGTGGRETFGGAVLTFNVSQLTASKASVPILVNGKQVGEIQPYFGAPTRVERALKYWYAQTISFDAGVLVDGKGGEQNEIKILATPIDPALAEKGEKYDDFAIKDVVCWYHQKSGSVVVPKI